MNPIQTFFYSAITMLPIGFVIGLIWQLIKVDKRHKNALTKTIDDMSHYRQDLTPKQIEQIVLDHLDDPHPMSETAQDIIWSYRRNGGEDFSQ